jgi:hypothetical protein
MNEDKRAVLSIQVRYRFALGRSTAGSRLYGACVSSHLSLLRCHRRELCAANWCAFVVPTACASCGGSFVCCVSIRLCDRISLACFAVGAEDLQRCLPHGYVHVRRCGASSEAAACDQVSPAQLSDLEGCVKSCRVLPVSFRLTHNHRRACRL